ncbi:hypothetical protein JCGZ_26303 [Jatropha curcas]|uniref:C3H1-type domain-containing protein n=1 Tax=Jatropha curcas TaxID=180498 RepID=A0A067JF50_JATCU|nr:zinc finger CCCH domain-containing protein 54 [Jatropha curcas]KDP22472.1 hypothetical protein JCGZ_26303 [Jatropha curcas]
MLTGINPTDYTKFYDFGDYAFSGLNVTPPHYDNIHDAIYGSDEFRMYAYKIKRCTRTRSHDWTECPYAHRGEKATRRDPRKVPYVAIACPGFRNGKCHKGDTCEYAHGVFEYWLHPARYRTRACNAGRFCQRKVCFFAHTPEQLRSEKKYACPFVYRARMNGGSEEGSTSSGIRMDELLNSLRNWNIVDEEKKGGGGIEESEGELAHLDWISELVK